MLIWDNSRAITHLPQQYSLFEAFPHLCFKGWGPFDLCRLAVVVLCNMCLLWKVMVNIVIPSKLLFSFFCRGNIRKQRLRAFIITNGWSGWWSHFLFYKPVDFFFLHFYQNAGDYLSLLNFDLHCSKGSKHFPVKSLCFKGLSGGFVYIYILKYEIFLRLFYFLFFLRTTVLFPSV